jgi:hypothetical protein
MSKDDQTGDDTPESDSLNKLLLRLQLPLSAPTTMSWRKPPSNRGGDLWITCST